GAVEDHEQSGAGQAALDQHQAPGVLVDPGDGGRASDLCVVERREDRHRAQPLDDGLGHGRDLTARVALSLTLGRCYRSANTAATRSRGSAGERCPSRPPMSSLATSVFTVASSTASTTAW